MASNFILQIKFILFIFSIIIILIMKIIILLMIIVIMMMIIIIVIIIIKRVMKIIILLITTTTTIKIAMIKPFRWWPVKSLGLRGLLPLWSQVRALWLLI